MVVDRRATVVAAAKRRKTGLHCDVLETKCGSLGWLYGAEFGEDPIAIGTPEVRCCCCY